MVKKKTIATLYNLRDVINIVWNDPEFSGIRGALEQTNRNDRPFSHLSEAELTAKICQHKTCLKFTLQRISLISQDLEQERLRGYMTRLQHYFKTHSSLKASAWTRDEDGDSYDQSVSIYKSKHSEEWQIIISNECSQFVLKHYSLGEMANLLFQVTEVTEVYDWFYQSAYAFGCCMSMVEECLKNMIEQLDK